MKTALHSTSHSHTHYRYISYAVISSILSSISNLFKSAGLRTVPPFLAASLGIIFGGGMSFAWLALNRKLPKFSKIYEVAWPLACMSISRSVVANILFTLGLLHSSAIKATFLTKMEPYMIIFWIWLLDGIRPKGRHLSLLLLHIFGAFLLSSGENLDTFTPQIGDMLIMLAVICASLSYRFATQVTSVLSPIQTAALTETIGGIITLPVALAVSPLTTAVFYDTGWVYIIVHALLFYTIAISLLYASLTGIPGWLSSALRTSGPLVAAPAAWIFLGERLSSIQIFGAILVLITSGLITRSETKTNPVQNMHL